MIVQLEMIYQIVYNKAIELHSKNVIFHFDIEVEQNQNYILQTIRVLKTKMVNLSSSIHL